MFMCTFIYISKNIYLYIIYYSHIYMIFYIILPLDLYIIICTLTNISYNIHNGCIHTPCVRLVWVLRFGIVTIKYVTLTSLI